MTFPCVIWCHILQDSYCVLYKQIQLPEILCYLIQPYIIWMLLTMHRVRWYHVVYMIPHIPWCVFYRMSPCAILHHVCICLVHEQATFKAEFINKPHFSSDEELNNATMDYVYVYYNHVRPHSSNNYMTPFEKRMQA